MSQTYVGNRKVPKEDQLALRLLKARKQGRSLVGKVPPHAWPALWPLPKLAQEFVVRTVVEERVWQVRSAMIGRYPNDIPPSIFYKE